MLDKATVREAFRDRLMTLVVATTGSTSLSATTAGYARAAGSFLTDGFAPGMEVIPLGFSVAGNNAVASGETYTGTVIISTVTATLMTIVGGRTAEAAGAGKSITVGLPADRQWEGTQTPVSTAPATRPKILEQRVPAGTRLVSFPAQGAEMEPSGLYVITWYGLGNKGILAMDRQVDAVKALFASGTVVYSAAAGVVRVRGGLDDAGPNEGQYITTENGYLTCQITIPWRGQTINAIAA